LCSFPIHFTSRVFSTDNMHSLTDCSTTASTQHFQEMCFIYNYFMTFLNRYIARCQTADHKVRKDVNRTVCVLFCSIIIMTEWTIYQSRRCYTPEDLNLLCLSNQMARLSRVMKDLTHSRQTVTCREVNLVLSTAETCSAIMQHLFQFSLTLANSP